MASTTIYNDDGDANWEDDIEIDEVVEAGRDLVYSILQGDPSDEIKSKVENGAPVWFQIEDGTSPLHAAAYNEDAALVKYLIEQGAVWNSGMF